MTNSIETIKSFEFKSPRQLRLKTVDGQDLVFFTGYVVLPNDGLKGNQDGSSRSVDLEFELGSRWDAPPPRVAPVVSLARIENAGSANNAIWAVEDCSPIFRTTDGFVQVVIRSRLTVRDRDGLIERLSYSVTMVGQLH